jgi:two-component system, OmpR family, alkaline phosphatase synthesis response regulator PhoP
MNRKHILIVEDEPSILELIEYNLLKAEFKVSTAIDGEQGLELINQTIPDLVLLDLMLPKIDGIEVCRLLKISQTTSSIPVIMVTAKGEEEDVIAGLESGADDYIIKPFSSKEMIARINAVLRRKSVTRETNKTKEIVYEDLTINISRHEVRINDRQVVFTATELRLLHFLASNPGQVFTRNQLMNQVLSESTFIFDRNIDVHIRSIRKKMGSYRDLILTIRGVGYRFIDQDDLQPSI